MSRVVFSLLTVILCASHPLHAGLIAPDGRPYAEIVIAPDAPRSVQLAAKEFSAFLAQITGEIPVPIRNTGKKNDELPAVFIGHSEGTARKGLEADDLPPDGFRILSTKDALYLVGADNYGPDPLLDINPWRAQEMVNSELGLCALGASGTLYAVYRFLQEYAGCRWFWPGETGTVVPDRKNIALKEFSLTDAPEFDYRYSWFHMAFLEPDNLLWLKRIGFGGRRPVFAQHNYKLFTEKYKNSHPEYFALVNGERDTGNLCAVSGGGHLCLTNPAVVEAFAQLALEYFDRNPQVDIFPAVPMDGLNRVCECESCQAEIDYDKPASSRFSNHVFNFANKVARRVAELRPGKFISCLSYPNHAGIPDKIRKFEPNLIVIVVYSRVKTMYARGYADAVHRELKEWSRITDHLYTWNHYLEHWNEWQGLPVGFPGLYQNEYAFLKSLGSWRGEFIEAEGQLSLDRLSFPGTQHIGLLLSARCMWHPDFDLDAYMADYYRTFYGPAEVPMRNFWSSSFEKFRSSSRRVLAEKDRMVPEDVFDAETLRNLSDQLERAKNLVPAESVYSRRIDTIAAEFLPAAQRLARFAESGGRLLTVTESPLEAKLVKMVGKKGNESLPATWMRVYCDAMKLYCDFFCYFDGEESRCTDKKVLARDDYAIWNRDVIEIFISPEPEEPQKCFQIVVDFDGNVWDARYFIGGVMSEAWNCRNMKVTVRREENRAVVSLSVPFADLEMARPEKKDIPANFYRSFSPDLKKDPACWSPTFVGMHYIPERFGKLRFQKGK